MRKTFKILFSLILIDGLMFGFINTVKAEGYEIKDGKVYFQNQEIKEADPNSFKVFYKDYAKDDNYQYASGKPYIMMDINNLDITDAINITNIDVLNLNTGGYIIKNNNIFYNNQNCSRYNNKMYCQHYLIPEADLASFEIIDKNFAKDKENTYFKNIVLGDSIDITNINLYNKIKGKIIIKVEENGEAYYINPKNQEMFFLARPQDAFKIMCEQGIGISEKDFNSFNGKAPQKLAGTILLRVEANGEAYYVNPTDLKLYYLGRPADAFKVMRELGLGISNNDFNILKKYKFV